MPRIAESWEVSPDGLTWRITVRPNVFFHDGSPVDAAAVKTVLDTAIATPGIGELYPGLVDVRGVTTDGSHTLVVDLKRPSAFLVDDLDIPLTKRSADDTRIGTGPYYPVSTSTTEARFRAHDKYHFGSPQIQEVVFRPYPTLRQAWASLLRGEIDVVSNVSGDALEFVAGEAVQTFSFPRHYAYVIAFNSARPQFRSAAVRRALNAAVDRDAIIRSALKGRGEPAESPVWPNHWAYDRSVQGYRYDPSLVRTTLSAAGVEKRGLNRDVPARLRFTCLIASGLAIHERLALVVQRQFYDIGVDMQLESLPLKQLDARIRRGDFDAMVADFVSAPTLSRVYQFWRSPGEFRGLNVFGYRNESADNWLDRLRYATDDATTRAATSQLQRVLIDDPPALFLAWSQRSRVVSRRIEVPGERNHDPFQNTWQWRIRRERELTEE